MSGKFFARQRQSLAFIGDHIASSEKAGRTLNFAGWSDRLPVATHQAVFQPHHQIELGGGKNITPLRTRGRAANARNLSFQSRVGGFLIADLKSTSC